MPKAGGLIGTGLIAYAVGGVIGESPRRARRQQVVDTRHRSSDEPRTGLKARIDSLQKRNRAVAFAYAVIKKYGEDGGGRLAATVAYYAFFSVFPALLALVAIAGFVLDDDPALRADVVDTAIGQFPVIGQSISEASLGGSGPALAVGVAGAIWAGLGAMLATQHALNTVWDVPWHERPDAVRSRLRGLLMFVVIGVGLVGATVLTNLVTALSLPGIAKVGIAAANVAVNVGIALLAFQILTQKNLRWRDLVPGAVLAGLVFYALQTLGSVLVDRYVTNASDTYGTFALVIGLLTWFHLAAQATLLAAEVNVVSARKLHPRTLFGDQLTEADQRALRRHQEAAARHPLAPPRAA